MYNLQQLRRLRWGVLVVVVIGIAGSVTMNVLHAPDNPIARAVAGAPPLAVFLTLELISRIPSSNRWLSAGRIAGSLIVAAVGGSISYAQQMTYVRELGFAEWEATIWPACVDGLMMVATLSLVEVVRKIRQLDAPAQVTPEPVAQAQQVVAAEVTRLPVPVSPAPMRNPERLTTRSGPIVDREVISPLTGRVLTDRAPKA